MLTIYEKREPQTIGPISRTNQITPVEPTHHHHRTSTVYVTVTEIPYVSTSTPHHHPHSVTTYTIIVSSSTDDSYPSPTGTVIETTVTLPFAPTSTGSDIDATVTLPFISSATETDDATTVTEFVINTPTPLAKRDAEPQLPDSFTLGWPISATYISPPKENPCQNNIFAPPEWCSNGSPTFGITTVTVTYTGTVFENTATLAPLTIGEPGWGRRDKRSRLRAEVEEKERRQQLLGTQTRSFTYAPGTSAPPLV
ncbi:uncharacterized protein LY89DRAFT_410969 [Mollisia scopiformis]|uniref:Uncharacterized protein n=1 Tax=Mollisia scopiformis TaxID=149040 RepID=A0A132B1X5_MOLSC|nr:uncharacterized protein LY89DRAFT_410969 [Mollisia scopiformis]KUJ06380.1 hypothetical protein LY89DRAFT_410969 [Mollisia scopiformis]